MSGCFGWSLWGSREGAAWGQLNGLLGIINPLKVKKCQDLCQSVIFVFLQRLLSKSEIDKLEGKVVEMLRSKGVERC